MHSCGMSRGETEQGPVHTPWREWVREIMGARHPSHAPTTHCSPTRMPLSEALHGCGKDPSESSVDGHPRNHGTRDECLEAPST